MSETGPAGGLRAASGLAREATSHSKDDAKKTCLHSRRRFRGRRAEPPDASGPQELLRNNLEDVQDDGVQDAGGRTGILLRGEAAAMPEELPSTSSTESVSVY